MVRTPTWEDTYASCSTRRFRTAVSGSERQAKVAEVGETGTSDSMAAIQRRGVNMTTFDSSRRTAVANCRGTVESTRGLYSEVHHLKHGEKQLTVIRYIKIRYASSPE